MSDANPDKYPDGPTDEFHGRYSASFIRNLRNNYRRNRDLCIILSGADNRILTCLFFRKEDICWKGLPARLDLKL